MVNQIILVLVLQTVFFSFYYKFGTKVANLIGRRVCPVCFAVGSTWLSFLFLKYSGIFEINTSLIAILLAESLAGISYLVEEFQVVRQTKLPEAPLKFGIIIWGTLAITVFSFINSLGGLILFIPVIIFGFLALTPTQKVEQDKNGKSSLLQSRLKKCC